MWIDEWVVGGPRRIATAGCAALCATILVACGGSSLDLAGVGSGGSGLAEGTVSGFGSLFVDGVEYDDSAAVTSVEDATGQLNVTTASVGQRVRVRFDAQARASSVQVLPQLVGPVTGVAAGGWLRVLGQWVQIFDQTIGATPATVLAGGVASSASFDAGDAIEAHGTWVFDPTRGAHVLQATRVERLATVPSTLLLGGVVAAVGDTGLRLNSTTGTTIVAPSLPADVVANSVVTVWAAAFDTAGDRATAIRVRANSAASTEGARLSLTGNVLALDMTRRRISVQGVTAQIPPMLDPGAVEVRDFVRIVATADASGWLVNSVQPHASVDQFGGTVHLRGAIKGIDWSSPGPLTFALRGTRVTLSANLLATSGCHAHPPATPVMLDVVAPRGPEPLVATSLSCSGNVPANAVVMQTMAH